MTALTELRDELQAANAAGLNGFTAYTGELPPIIAALSTRVPLSVTGNVSPDGRFVNATVNIRFTLDMNDEPTDPKASTRMNSWICPELYCGYGAASSDEAELQAWAELHASVAHPASEKESTE